MDHRHVELALAVLREPGAGDPDRAGGAAVLGNAAAGAQAALLQLRVLAYREAATLAYADAFRAIMLAFVLATLAVPFLRKMGAPAAP